MTKLYKPKISLFSSEKGKEEVRLEAERRREEMEISRSDLGKNIILPKIAQYQFSEWVEIYNSGNTFYARASPEDLFKQGWQSFRATLPSPITLSRELASCNIKREEYETFLRRAFGELCGEGLIEDKGYEKNIDLAREGSVYESAPGVWKETGTGNFAPSNIKTVRKQNYALKEGTEWYEMLKKTISHDNPIGISMGDFSIGIDRYGQPFKLSATPYQNYARDIGMEIQVRSAERRKKVIPNLARRLMRLHHNLMRFYRDSTRDIIYRSRGMSKIGPPRVFENLLYSLPERMGKIMYDASELARNYNLGRWPEELAKAASEIDSREEELRGISKEQLQLELENMKSRGRNKSEYSGLSRIMKGLVFQTVPFAFNARDDMERILGYGKKTYVFI